MEDKYGPNPDELIEKLLKDPDIAEENQSDSDSSGTDSESDTDEDEFGQELTPAIDAQIPKTIAAIRTRDKSVYDSQHRFFDGKFHSMINKRLTFEHK